MNPSATHGAVRVLVCESRKDSYKFYPSHRLRDHPQQQPPVRPSLNIGCTISALAITHRQIGDFQVIFGGAEQQIEIAEGIEVAEIGTVGRDHFIMLLA